MDQTTNSFGYKPLVASQEIRLVHLQPDVGSELVHCRLEHCSLERPSSPYEALSYVWGNPTDVHPIFLDGELFQVTANLGWALWHLCLEDRPRTLWVDAICINQADRDERGH